MLPVTPAARTASDAAMEATSGAKPKRQRCQKNRRELQERLQQIRKANFLDFTKEQFENTVVEEETLEQHILAALTKNPKMRFGSEKVVQLRKKFGPKGRPVQVYNDNEDATHASKRLQEIIS